MGSMYLPCPPAHGYPDDGEELPPFVLIEPYAYFADRDNATTAATCGMDGFDGRFKVTFCTASPPLVSYMCFQATPYGDAPFALAPEIIATETNGSRVLLRLVFGKHPTAIMYPHNRHYLIYDASGPSLEHLPHPGHHRFCDESLAFVRKCAHGGDGSTHDCSSSCGYVIAGHSGAFGDAGPYQLCLYHSDTRTWQQKEMVLKPSPYRAPCHSTCKAITIGGDQGTVAWVDLWHNILLCNVLAAGRPELRSLKLPPPILSAHEVRPGNPMALRDIALLDGFFKYAQIQPGSCALGRWEWELTVWSAKTSSSLAKDWIVEHKLKSSEIRKTTLRLGPGEGQRTLSTLQIGLPNLSLQNAGIVYLLSKVNHRDNDNTAWVVALDIRSKTIQKVGEFSAARTLGLAKGYNASRISEFLKGSKQTQERPGPPETPMLKCPGKKPSSMRHAGTSMVQSKTRNRQGLDAGTSLLSYLRPEVERISMGAVGDI